MKNVLKYILSGVVMLGAWMLIAAPANAVSGTVYGALYNVANLTADAGNGSNYESSLTYYGGEDGIVALTNNSGGSLEWWTSNKLGLVWNREATSPLEDYNCTSPGRHSIHTFRSSVDGEAESQHVYFAAGCDENLDGTSIETIFRLDSNSSATMIHENTSDNKGVYPTVALLDGSLYFFYNGGYTVCDSDESCTEVEDAVGQTNGVPLEASKQNDGVIYLPRTDGSVLSFDGTEYTEIGTDYLDASGPMENLPSISFFNDTLYVGEQNSNGEARLWKYDENDEDEDGELWEVAHTFSSDDTIINKMRIADDYLIIYTSNVTGTGVYSMDTDETVTQVVDSGLGGVRPAKNREVVGAIYRTIRDNGVRKNVMFFGTQNKADETKVFALILGNSLPFNPLAKNVVSSTASYHSLMGSSATVTQGDELKIAVPKKKTRNRHDKFALFVNDKKKDVFTVKKNKKYVLSTGTNSYDSGDELTVQVGRKINYGRKKKNRQLSNNWVMGEELTVTIQ